MASAEFWGRIREHLFLSSGAADRLARRRTGVSVAWRPFLLGPIFAAQGWRDLPFNIYPAKGRYMWRDLQRICDAMGIPLKRPEPFPQPSLMAARIALAVKDEARPNFSRQVYIAEFGQGLPIADRAALAALLAKCGIDPVVTLERAESDLNKALLRAECSRAAEIGVIGAPCLVTQDGEVFWGNDRLEQGLDWAARRRP